jgi:site-specific recombinase XerD
VTIPSPRRAGQWDNDLGPQALPAAAATNPGSRSPKRASITQQFAIYVWRSVRADGDTKTEKSRRTLQLPGRAADALTALHKRQADDRRTAGAARRDHGLVFCTRVGTPLSAANVRRSFRAITKAAQIGKNWTPRELRHSFVSIMSDNGVPLEAIADLVGHKNSTVTARVYRHQLRP